jgi:hypothetical protein
LILALELITYDTKKNIICYLPISYGFHSAIFFRNNTGRINKENYPFLFKLYHYNGNSVEFYASHIDSLIIELKDYCKFVEGHQQKITLIIKRISDSRVWKVEVAGD